MGRVVGKAAIELKRRWAASEEKYGDGFDQFTKALQEFSDHPLTDEELARYRAAQKRGKEEKQRRILDSLWIYLSQGGEDDVEAFWNWFVNQSH